MTTVAFGGGPNLDQRRSFAALRDGTHVPGYRGYCPQIKYRVGKTYGTDTHELAQDTIHLQPASVLASAPEGLRTTKNVLPMATGDNKYTEKMIPGYTGYIPRMPFKFGNTYKEDCDFCIDEYMTNRKFNDTKTMDLKRQVAGYPRLTAISHDPEVRDKLNLYRDTHPNRPILMDDKRALTEPPVPGYRGYIPRIKTTEMGLGARYNRTTKRGLEMFAQETAASAQRITGTLPASIERVPTDVLQGSQGDSSKRLYLTDGMIPKYTGYVPQRRFAFGNTYGDTTRGLEVCAHPLNSFGDFKRSRTSVM
ncbi:hypothetical protein FSP39_008834 [Pinctada imbricata]|uniref:Protein FAM166B n=1 Tax=Pinctada imbricata TaxID=66713 RepID=A0AA89BM29_PINIB|nr:hypothetical protein FSP39_008834 [Pinctada imbricata]